MNKLLYICHSSSKFSGVAKGGPGRARPTPLKADRYILIEESLDCNTLIEQSSARPMKQV